MADKDLYKLLGVPRDADTKTIKKAYRRLARKYHPDVNPGNKAAEERFKEISAAADILADPEKRKRYDEFGMDGVRGGFDPERAREYRRWREAASGGFGGPDVGDGAFGGGRFHNFEDMFGDLFGGASKVASRGPAPGADVEADVEIDFLDAVRGGEVDLRLEKPAACRDCQGTGARDARFGRCPDCRGSGRVKLAQGILSFDRSCARCAGTGRVPEAPCQSCMGSGQQMGRTTLKVKVPPGVSEGTRVRLAGQGAPGKRGGPPGDLYVRARVRPHPFFRRSGDDLDLSLPITVGEAAAGATVRVPTPDGSVNLKIPPRSQSGNRLRLKGKGVRSKGDLYVVLHIHLPEEGGAEVERLARELDRQYRRDVRADLKV